MTLWVIEWIWAFYAYVCGRILHFEQYCILRARYDDDTNLVRFPFPVSPSCLKKLMSLWGFREIVGEELEEVLNNVTPFTAPFLGCGSVESHSVTGISKGCDARTVCGMIVLLTFPLVVALVEYLIDLINK